MRLEALKPITLRNKVLTGHKPLICVPLASMDEKSLISETHEVISLSPSMIEWCADYFEETPSGEFIMEKIKNEIDSGGDIGKISVMAKD